MAKFSKSSILPCYGSTNGLLKCLLTSDATVLQVHLAAMCGIPSKLFPYLYNPPLSEHGFDFIALMSMNP